jgi:predicted GNAT family acetyltransferase
MIEPISSANTVEAAAYLAISPYENAFLAWLVASGINRRCDRDVCFLSRDKNGGIDGVCYFGAQFVPAARNDAALEAFAQLARAMPPERMIVGSRAQIERWWEYLRPWHRPPRAVRTRQPLYAISRATLRGSRNDANVGQATLEELDAITRESAAMIAHEIGIAPNPNAPAFRERAARIIRMGWEWRWHENGELRFQCNIGALTAQTAQIQGVWTPQNLRGHGYATRALGAICDHLLDRSPTLSLYVNDFNLTAIAVYERLGFSPVGEFTTMLF